MAAEIQGMTKKLTNLEENTLECLKASIYNIEKQ